MLSLNRVRTGVKILFQNQPYEVIAVTHLKMGRSGAKLITKLRNLLTQSIVDYTFSGDEKLEPADISYRAAQYLYSQGETAFFMTTDAYEQMEAKLSSSQQKFLVEGGECDLLLWKNQIIDVKLPPKITLKVDYTEPGFKGDTATAAFKQATLENGSTVQVPLFIKDGDMIRVSTETGQYDSRA